MALQANIGFPRHTPRFVAEDFTGFPRKAGAVVDAVKQAFDEVKAKMDVMKANQSLLTVKEDDLPVWARKGFHAQYDHC